MVKHSHPAEHPVTTEAVAHASGLWSLSTLFKSRNQGNGDTTSHGAGPALWSSILTQQSSRLQQKQLLTPVAFDRCQLCSSRPKSRNQGNGDTTSRGAGLALWSSILTQQSTRLQHQQLHTPVAFDRCQLCSSPPKSRNQGNAESTSRCAGLALWSSILTQQSTRLPQKQLHTPVAFDRCELCSSRPKSRKPGQR